MEITNEIRELGNATAKQSAEMCIKCNHKCFMYVVFMYVKENGYEHFIYHYEHNSLPKEVSIAYSNLMQILGALLEPDAFTLINIPWCKP